MRLVVRTDGPRTGLAAEIRDEVQRLKADQPVSSIQSLDTLRGQTMGRNGFVTVLLAVFAAVAMLLAAIGIYGVLAYVVTQRTQEMAIRMALGASARDVVSLVVREGARLALVGGAAGLLAALALARSLESLLFEISVADPVTFAAVPVVLAAVALVAAYLPARRAARIDPMAALRAE